MNTHLYSEDPIGLFDSGVGGLTVMKQLLKVLPCENYVYFGDTARLPYGEKSPETIIRYSLENAAFLLENKIKLLVVACNTASAYALDELQGLYDIPVVGVIEPGADRTVGMSKTGRIAVLGTRATIRSQAYREAILKRAPTFEVISIACPLLVPLVEEQYILHPATKLIVQEYLKPLKGSGVDTILLGCTHYPLLREVIEEVLGADVIIVDSANSCAEKVIEVLAEKNLQSSSQESIDPRYFVSDDAKKFQQLGERFLGISIPHVELSGCLQVR